MLIRSEDGTTEGSAIEKYYQAIIPAFEKAGYPTRPGPQLEEWFRETGFVNIHVHKYRVPIGVWPKDSHYVSNHPPSCEFFFKKRTTANLINLSMDFTEKTRNIVSTKCRARFRRSCHGCPDEVRIMVP